MRMWIICVSGNRKHGPDRLWENSRFITLSLMVVSDFLFRIRSIGLAGFPALVLGDRRYVSCFAFPLGSCRESLFDRNRSTHDPALYRFVDATRVHR
jgi:hypothetical protein